VDLGVALSLVVDLLKVIPLSKVWSSAFTLAFMKVSRHSCRYVPMSSFPFQCAQTPQGSSLSGGTERDGGKDVLSRSMLGL